MISFAEFSERLKRLDILQLAIGLFTVLIGTIIFTWPISANKANDSYYSLSLIRVSFLALAAFYYGNYSDGKSSKEIMLELMALFFLAVVTIPIEYTSYALSLPQSPLYWPIFLAFLDILAFFALGLLLSGILGFLKLKLLASLFILGIFFGLFWLDIKIGYSIFSPISAVSKLSFAHIIAMLSLASITVWKLRKNSF